MRKCEQKEGNNWVFELNLCLGNMKNMEMFINLDLLFLTLTQLVDEKSEQFSNSA